MVDYGVEVGGYCEATVAVTAAATVGGGVAVEDQDSWEAKSQLLLKHAGRRAARDGLKCSCSKWEKQKTRRKTLWPLSK